MVPVAREAETVPVAQPQAQPEPEPPAEVRGAVPQEVETVPVAQQAETVPVAQQAETVAVPSPDPQPEPSPADDAPAVAEPAPARETPAPTEDARPALAAVPRRPLPFAFHTTDVVIDLPAMVQEAGPDSALARQLDALREMSRSPGRTAIDQEAIAQTAERIVDALVPRLLGVARGHTRLLFRFPAGDVIAASAANVAQATADLLHRRVYLVLGESTILAELCPHGHG